MYEVTLEDYIRLASDVYKPGVEFFYPEERLTDLANKPDKDGFYYGSLLQKEHGWTRLLESEPDPTGFFAAYYIRTDIRDKVGVIVYRGSDDVYDFVHHDLKLAYDQWPKVYTVAENFYQDIQVKLKPTSLSFAGHSLGGALAQLVAMYANENEYFHKEKCRAICFNAPQMGYIKRYVEPKKIRLDSNIDHAVEELRTKFKNQHWALAVCNAVNKADEFAQFFVKDVRAKLVASGLSYSCSALRGLFHLIPDFKNLGDELKPSLVDLYKRFAYSKNFADCVKYGQPAFNVIYHLVTAKPDQDAFDHKSFTQHYAELVTSGRYDYIYNFNALYDVVHVCGMPIGNQIEIDIDHQKYHALRKFSVYDKKLREQAELRTFLTLQPEYFSHVPQKIALNKTCEFDLQRDVLSHLDVNYDGYLSLAGKFINNILNKRWADEAAYCTATQHSMDNLAAALLAEKALTQITFNGRSAETTAKLADFRTKNPLPTFDNSFHSKIKDMIIDAGLVNPVLCQAG